MRRRLLVILNRAAINGAVRQLSLWLPGLNPDEFAIKIAFLKDRGPLAEAVVPRNALTTHGYLRWRWDLVGCARFIVAARRWRPEVVFSLDERNAAVLARLVGLATRALVVEAVHSSPRPESSIPLWNRATSGLVDTVLAVSRLQKQLLVARGVPSEKISVVYNGVPVKARQVTHTGSDSITAVFVGVLRHDKRVDLLIRALALIADRTPNLRLCVVGGGECERELKDLAHRLGVHGRICWEGWQSDIDPYLYRGSFLVLASDPGVETLSMAALEAMAVGLPVVCTDVGSMAEVVDSSVGRLVPPGNVEALAGAILELYQRDKMRVEMGAAAAIRQQSLFSSDRMVREMQAILLSKAGRRREVCDLA